MLLPNQSPASWRALQAVAILLCGLLAAPPCSGQAAQAESPTQLNIVIVEGDGAVNNLRQRVVREPIVRVEDENHKPVAGALVTFLLPGNGASGTFANGAKLLTVTTDANGQAVAHSFRANNVSGQYQIKVTASMGKTTATTNIAQSNIAAAAGGGGAAGGAAISGKLIAVLVVVGAAAAAGVAVAVTRGNGTSPPATTGLTPGTPSVGGPH